MIHETVKQVRKQLGINQGEMCKRVGVSVERYSNFEKTGRSITAIELDTIMLELGLEIVPIQRISLDQNIIRKIRELAELVK